MADSGLKFPSARAVRVAGWTAPSNAFADDGAMANCLVSAVGAQEDYYNFNFSIPGAIIQGIEVFVEGSANGPLTINGDNIKIHIALSQNGGSSFSAEKEYSFPLEAPDTVGLFGGAADLWGLTWNAGHFTNGNFRLYLEMTSSTGGGTDINIDYIQVRVTYTPVGGGLLTMGVGS